ncbi:nuclear transport factor 2-like [Andrographis paniculata]|uniref:nuclear transport factor 2-like n=1 Tax=Andrographis paniculata TaxID=175694 RepID=UPI0021E97103|nr:nuclear transport factor 2-like [Andrographis paniculata]
MEDQISKNYAETVSNFFVKQYYQTLERLPDELYRFYKDCSTLGWPHTGGIVTPVTTLREINDRIISSNFVKSSVKITSVVAQDSADGGVLVVVIGVSTGEDEVERIFSQTIFLATQPSGYFILNDVLRFITPCELKTDMTVNGNNSIIDQVETIAENSAEVDDVINDDNVNSDPAFGDHVNLIKTNNDEINKGSEEETNLLMAEKGEGLPQIEDENVAEEISHLAVLNSNNLMDNVDISTTKNVDTKEEDIVSLSTEEVDNNFAAKSKKMAAVHVSPDNNVTFQVAINISVAPAEDSNENKFNLPISKESPKIAVEDTKKVEEPVVSYASILSRGKASSAGQTRRIVPNNYFQAVTSPRVENSDGASDVNDKEWTPLSKSVSRPSNYKSFKFSNDKSIHVGGLPLHIDKESVLEVVKQFGQVKNGLDSVLICRAKNGFCYGFVEFESEESAQRAVEARRVSFGENNVAVISYKKSSN